MHLSRLSVVPPHVFPLVEAAKTKPSRGTIFRWAPSPGNLGAEGSFGVSPGKGVGVERDRPVPLPEDAPQVREACARLAKALRGREP